MDLLLYYPLRVISTRILFTYFHFFLKHVLFLIILHLSLGYEPPGLLLFAIVNPLTILLDDLIAPTDNFPHIGHQSVSPFFELIELLHVVSMLFMQTLVDIEVQLPYCLPQQLPSGIGSLAILDQLLDHNNLLLNLAWDKLNRMHTFANPPSNFPQMREDIFQ